VNNPSHPLMIVKTPPRRHKGSTLLSPRDRWAFQWIAQQYALSLEHLPWLLGQRAGYGAKSPHRISESAARQVLARWHKQGYIEQKNIFTDSSPWIWPSKAAMDELGLSYSYAVPHFASLPHLHAVAHVRRENLRVISTRRLVDLFTYSSSCSFSLIYSSAWIRSSSSTSW
jgi:hypothetical protein